MQLLGRRPKRTPSLLLMALALLAVACSTGSEIEAETGEATTDATPIEAAGPTATPGQPLSATPTPVATTVPQPTVETVVTEPTPVTVPTPDASGRPGRSYLCTRNVEFDEVLNVRGGPSLDAEVIARVPGGSCALTADVGVDRSADWVAVVYETAHARHEGFVSGDFVQVHDGTRHETVALAWMQGMLDGRDVSDLAYAPYLADSNPDVVTMQAGSDRQAAPFISVGAEFCTLIGDVTVQCPIVVRNRWHPVDVFVVSLQQRGTNGYDGDDFFPSDFGDGPLVIGVERPAGARGCFLVHQIGCEDVNWATVSIDGRSGPLGLSLGSSPERGLAYLEVFYGPPTDDTGWIVGCPLDGEDDLNERYVSWGPLNLAFQRWTEAPDGELWYWYYDLDAADVDDGQYVSPRLVDLALPGRLGGAVTLTELSEATRLPIETHELLQEPVIFGPGWTLFGEQRGDTVALTRAAVPFIGICD